MGLRLDGGEIRSLGQYRRALDALARASRTPRPVDSADLVDLIEAGNRLANLLESPHPSRDRCRAALVRWDDARDKYGPIA